MQPSSKEMLRPDVAIAAWKINKSERPTLPTDLKITLGVAKISNPILREIISI